MTAHVSDQSTAISKGGRGRKSICLRPVFANRRFNAEQHLFLPEQYLDCLDDGVCRRCWSNGRGDGDDTRLESARRRTSRSRQIAPRQHQARLASSFELLTVYGARLVITFFPRPSGAGDALQVEGMGHY